MTGAQEDDAQRCDQGECFCDDPSGLAMVPTAPVEPATQLYNTLQGQMTYLARITADIEVFTKGVVQRQNKLAELHKIRKDVADDVRRLARELHEYLDGERGW